MALSDHSLGRSVGDVLAKTAKRSPDPHRGYMEIDIGLITPSRSNPRKEFDQAALDDLAAVAFSSMGCSSRIVVLKQEVGYEILSGERRYRAARQLGLPRIPVVVRDRLNPQHLAELRLVENIQREDLNPIELALGYQALLETHGLTHEEVAVRVNKDRTSISNLLRLLALPGPIRQGIASGDLSTGHAKALLGCADAAWQQALAERIVAEHLSVRETERLVQAGAPPTDASAPAGKPPHLRELETNLYLLLGIRVKIAEKGGGKGSLTAHFRDQAQFQQVVTLLEQVTRTHPAAGAAAPAAPAPSTPGT